MAQEERYGNRDLTYSAWHRSASTSRYVGSENARLLAMIDLDHVLWLEYDDETKEPLALIEEARDVEQPTKSSTVTRNLARRAGLPALVVLWKPGDEPNPTAPEWKDITAFRIKRLWPVPESDWRRLSPEEWAQTLLRVRTFPSEKIDEWLFGNRKDDR